jgi:SAM-dependent methyltransferase
MALVLCAAPVAQAQSSAQNPLSDIFTELWRTHGWQGSESLSGPGSSLEETRVVRDKLTQLIKTYNVTSIVDLACGDFYWMQHVDLAGATYTGVDIVAPMIKQLQQQYQTEDNKRVFLTADVTKDKLPKADLVIARDVIGHLTLENGLALIANARASGSTYLLSTYFTARRANEQITDGNWRPVDLSQPPYNLGAPIAVIHEDCAEGNGVFADKELGLWRL